MTDTFRAMCAELADDLELCDWPYKLKDAIRADIERARALLAEPEAEGPTDDELWTMYDEMCGEPGDWAWVRDYARARWGRPAAAPVPVSERLPGPEDCLDEGWAWFFNQRIGWRQAVLPVSPGYTHWLPANALPLPAPEGGELSQ